MNQQHLSAELQLTRRSTVEVFTPAPLIEAARILMGSIDLDVASCTEAQTTVQAAHYFTAKNDALMQPQWWGNVWCNPPYAHGGQRKFARRLLQEIHNGHVKAAMLLGFWAGSAWVDEISREATLILHLKQRLPWRTPTGNKSRTPNMASFAIWALGNLNLERLPDALQAAGDLIVQAFQPVNTPRNVGNDAGLRS